MRFTPQVRRMLGHHLSWPSFWQLSFLLWRYLDDLAAINMIYRSTFTILAISGCSDSYSRHFFLGLCGCGGDCNIYLQRSLRGYHRHQSNGLCINRAWNHQVAEGEVIELLTTVLAGVSNIQGVPVNPQDDLKHKVDIRRPGAKIRRKISVPSSDILDGQVSSGTTVGARILLYIGSFIYSIVSLSSKKGDKDTARALAFGTWWIIIVHVSTISGSLLAISNPSLASIIFPKKRVPLSLARRHEHANRRSETEDQV